MGSEGVEVNTKDLEVNLLIVGIFQCQEGVNWGKGITVGIASHVQEGRVESMGPCSQDGCACSMVATLHEGKSLTWNPYLRREVTREMFRLVSDLSTNLLARCKEEGTLQLFKHKEC